MLISFHHLVQKYGIELSGILHVGAHECEELHDYEKYLPRDRILWVEAMPTKVEWCRRQFPGILIETAVVLDTVETVEFHVSNNGQSSSILEFGLHSHFHPHVHYVDSFRTTTKLLKDILINHDIPINFVNLDIQGVELRALKGMENYLDRVDYLYTEINSDHVYKDCTLISELDEYLSKLGLIRVETVWTDCRWGDAFYIRKQHPDPLQ